MQYRYPMQRRCCNKLECFGKYIYIGFGVIKQLKWKLTLQSNERYNFKKNNWKSSGAAMIVVAAINARRMRYSKYRMRYSKYRKQRRDGSCNKSVPENFLNKRHVCYPCNKWWIRCWQTPGISRCELLTWRASNVVHCGFGSCGLFHLYSDGHYQKLCG